MGGFILTEGNEVSGQQAAQPATTSQGVQPPGQPLSPDVIQLLRGEIKNALGEFSREQQSQRDKQERRITDRVKGLESTFKSLNGGQDLTPEQRNQLRSVAAEQIEAEPLEHTEPSKAQAAQPTPKAEEPSAVEKLILKKFQKAGVTIEDGDPELVSLKGIDPTDLDDLKEKIDAAIEAKRARLQTKPSNLDPSTASARVSAAVATGSPTNLETQYYAELDKVRGNIDAILSIKTKYRKLGLQV